LLLPADRGKAPPLLSSWQVSSWLPENPHSRDDEDRTVRDSRRNLLGRRGGSRLAFDHPTRTIPTASETTMKMTPPLALSLLLLLVPVAALAAPAEGDLDVIYLADMQPLDSNSVQANRRPGTSVVRAEMDGTLYES